MKEQSAKSRIRAGHRKFVVASVFLMLAVFSLAIFVWADGNTGDNRNGPEMQAGMGDITRGSNICMGDITNGYAGNQLKWTVLDHEKDNAGNPGAMFLFSKGVVAEADSKGRAREFRYYNGWMNPLRKFTINNHWHHSSMPNWCDTFMKKVFTQAEQNAIRSVTKKEVPTQSIGPFKDKVLQVEPDGHVSYYVYYTYDFLPEPDTIHEQKVFFPSYDEIKNEDAYASMSGFNPTRYWLRTPGELYPYYELIDLFYAFVGIYTTHAEHKDYGKDHSPAFEYDDIAQKCMARPVMNIEKGSVIFSNVAGAKEGVNIGEMKELNLDRTDRHDWELSFEDPDRRGFDAEGVIVHSHSGNHTVEVKTSGAKTGENEYLSAIAMDEDGNILYYGRIKESTKEDDQFEIPVPWYNDRDGIKLYVFNEMYVGKEKSSSISPLRCIDLDDPEIAIHVVTFDLNGHGSPQPDWQEVEHGETATRPDDPFAVGYDFRGWFTEPETEIAWDFGSIVQDSMTLYAGWAPHTYEIWYDSNGGGGEKYKQDRTYQDANPIADCEFTPPSDNMKFTGWNTRKNGSGMNYYPGDTDDLTYNEDYKITLYAQWSEELMVAYHLNGHGGPQPDSEFTSADKGWKITKPKDPSDKAYDFGGWYMTPGCDQGDAWDFDNDALDNSTTLFAKWNPHKYTVHFEPNGADGSVTMEDQHREYGDNVPLDNEFVWQSSNLIKFMEWNTKPDGTGTSYENGYTGDLTDKDGDVITLYAIWIKDNYDVDFDKNEGSGDQMDTQRRSCSDPAPLYKNTYTREGYVFAGWNTEADGAGISYEDQSKKNIPNTTGSVRLYAQWVSEYTVHFDANGGNGKMPDVTRTIGDGKALPDNAFYRDSYIFGGWNTERDGSGTSYEDGFTGDLQVHADKITLYAQWDISYTIQYDGNEATSGFMEDQKRKYGDGESLTPNGFSREGFVFDGWNTREDGTGTDYADKSEGDLATRPGTVVLYAQWKAETVYKITFDANGGSFEGDLTTITETTDAYGYLKEFAPDPRSTSSPFYGWYSAKDGGVKVAEGARFTSDTKLYACWTPQMDDLDWDWMRFTGPFTVTYDPMGGSVDLTEQKTTAGSYIQNPVNQNRVYIIQHPTPKKDTYGFDGWYTAPEGGTLAVEGNYDYTNPPPAQYMSDTTLYAHWRPLKYTVRFNNNGGQGTMPDQHRTYDDGVKLAANTFIRTNYKFNGWNTDKDGHGMVYTDEELGNITDKEETVILYAQWKAEDYIVVFDMNGMDASPKPQPYSTGPKKDFMVEKPDEDPEAEGYTFEGWYNEPQCINEWDFDNDIVVDETTTLYAKWTGNPYTIKFDPGKGTVNESLGPMANQERIVGDGVALPPCTYDPPKNSSGALFRGWNTKKDGSGITFEDESTQDIATGGTVTLYALWSPTRIAVFDLNGRGTGTPPPQMRGEMHGYKVVKPQPDPTAKGYNFTGWYKDKDCTDIWDFDNDTLQKGVTTLYAGWEPIGYTVRFDANAPEGKTAEGQMDDVSRRYDDGEALPPVGFSIIEPNPRDEAYTFTGWNTEPDGSGDGFGDMDSQNITSTDGADITLYAMWDMAQITTTNLPDGMQDEYYEATLTQMGLMEEPPIQWSILEEDGDTGLPEGLVLDGETGVISGITTQAGTFTFTVSVIGINLMGDQESLTKKLTLDIMQKEPEVLIIEFFEGMNGRWTKGNSSTLDFKTNGPFNMFTGLDVDGVDLMEGRDYEASEGSTVIKLKPEYLNKISVGDHILTAHYNDGQAPFTQFTVVAKQTPSKPDDNDQNKNDDEDNDDQNKNNGDNDPAPGPDNQGNGDRDNGASTGDRTHVIFWMALFLISFTGSVFMIIRRRVRS